MIHSPPVISKMGKNVTASAGPGHALVGVFDRDDHILKRFRRRASQSAMQDIQRPASRIRLPTRDAGGIFSVARYAY